MKFITGKINLLLKKTTLVFFIFSIISCGSNKWLKTAMLESKETNIGSFVTTKDSVIVCSNLKYKLKIGGKYYFDVDNKHFATLDVLAYQDKSGYFVKVPKEFLKNSNNVYSLRVPDNIDRYAKRILKGSINYYSLSFVEGYKNRYDYNTKQTVLESIRVYYKFLQKNNGELIKYNYSNLLDMLEGYKPSLDLLQEHLNSKSKQKEEEQNKLWDAMVVFNKSKAEESKNKNY